MPRRHALILALALGALATVGCTSDDHAATDHDDTDTMAAGMESAQVTTINNVCPVGAEPLPDSPPTRTYKGHTIGFCCDACPETFMAWDESARDRWLVAALRNPNHTP